MYKLSFHLSLHWNTLTASFWLWEILGYSHAKWCHCYRAIWRPLLDVFRSHLQDIFKTSLNYSFQTLFKMCSKRFCTWISYKLSINIFRMTWNILLEMGLTLKTSRRSLQNVFISRDSFQRIWPNHQDVQKKSSERFHFWGLFRGNLV